MVRPIPTAAGVLAMKLYYLFIIPKVLMFIIYL